jgi:hypothetical protein
MNQSTLERAFKAWFAKNLKEGMGKMGIHPPIWKIHEMAQEAWVEFHAEYHALAEEDRKADEGEESAAEYQLEIGIFGE